MLTRRRFLTRGTLGMAALAGTALGFPGDGQDQPGALPDGSASKGMITENAERAIDRGLAYLSANRRGGQFGVRGAYAGNVAIASLAGLAFMAAGNQPDRGKYGRVVSEALRFVLDQERSDRRFPGYLQNPQASQHGPMYGHGFGTLFLGEAHGMVTDSKLRDELRDQLRLALQLIVKSQNMEGGWRYHPYTKDADLSVTVCQIMALRSGRNAGFAVPAEVVRKCIDYVKRCQDKRNGYFYYMAQGGAGPHEAFARTGAGLSALYKRRRLQRTGDRRGTAFPDDQEADRGRADVPAPGHAVLLWPLLRRSGDVDRRRHLLERVVPGHPRRVAQPSERGRLLGRRHRHPLRHRDGLHHPADPNNYLPILQK